ncbi:MAG TPA: hypothetical protein VN641_19985 [Urbifossiella sp.]|jgi:hypothetical protein|nr:hypothetical protein [Urbifossiella sp.]
MPATLIRDFAKNENERLDAALADLATLPEQLVDRREQLFRQAARQKQLRDLHDGRAEYFQVLEAYASIAEQFQALAEAVDSPLLRNFESIAERLREQSQELDRRWRSFDDLCELVVEVVQPSADRLRALAASHPAAESWLNETDDPFSAG